MAMSAPMQDKIVSIVESLLLQDGNSNGPDGDNLHAVTRSLGVGVPATSSSEVLTLHK
jgi:hypothetical protein